MRTIKSWQDKARLVGDITDLIGCLQHPLEKDDDENATLSIAIRESGVRTTRLYSEPLIKCENWGVYGDGTIHETFKMCLDKETRDCIVKSLQVRVEEIRRELKEVL